MLDDNQNFLSPPKLHHHVSRLMILVVILVVISLPTLLYMLFVNTQTAPMTEQNTSNTTIPSYESLMRQINTVSTQRASGAPNMSALQKQINQPSKARAASSPNYDELVRQINEASVQK